MAYFTKRFLRQFRANILTGMFVLIPVIASVFILVKLFMWADEALPAAIGTHWVPGLGILVSVVIAYFVGVTAKHWLGRKIIATGNSIIFAIPVLNKIYLVIKQIIDTVTVDKKKLFERAVLVEFPRKDSFVIGLVTTESNETFSVRAGRKLVAVFVPKVPNPTNGFLLYIPEEDLVPLDIPIEAALKIVMSAGILGAEKLAVAQKLSTADKQWKWTEIFGGKKRHIRPDRLHDPRD